MKTISPRTAEALARLEAAVARIETAARGGTGDAALGRELVAARADYAALREVTDTVSGRLDAAILRLQNALEA